MHAQRARPLADDRRSAPCLSRDRAGADARLYSAIWVHPTDRSESLVIGNTRNDDGGLTVWDLAGNELQHIGDKDTGKLDVRYNFPLAGHFADGTSHTRIDLIAVSLRNDDKIAFYKANPATRRIEYIGSEGTKDDLKAQIGCLYRSAASGKFYFFASAENGDTHQYELFDGGDGKVEMKLVRSFDVGEDPEGCVADDQLGVIYFSEDDRGTIWKYGAEPGAGSTRLLVDKPSDDGGHTQPDVEGLAIYHVGANQGYLIATNQGGGNFLVYRRKGANEYLGSFRILKNGSVDEVTKSVGIEVSNLALGPAFPKGILVASDDHDSDGKSDTNHKYVDWESIATALGLVPPDTTWDPRNP